MSSFKRWGGVFPLTLLVAAGLALSACGGDPTAVPATQAPQQSGSPTAEPTSVPPTAAPAFDAEAYFKGKTIRIVVGYTPGGSSDLQGRYLASQLPRFIPGKPRAVVTNMPGANAVIAANFVWNARPDGLAVFYGVGGTPGYQLEYGDQADFDFREVKRIGTFENRTEVWFVSDKAPYRRVQDAVGGDKEFTFDGGSSKGEGDTGLFLKEALRLPMRVVYGATSGGGLSEFLLNMERGDFHSAISGSGWYQLPQQREGWLRDERVMPFAITADPSLRLENNGEIDMPADVMNVVDLMDEAHKKEWQILSAEQGPLYRTGWIGPQVPDEVWNVYNDALAKAYKDPEFIAGLTKIMGRLPDELISGPELQKIANSFNMEELTQVRTKYDSSKR